VDGFNFYHGLMAKGWGRYRWLDYPALLQRRIRSGQVLGEIKYFTALVTHQPERIKRQETYLRALEVRGGVTTIRGSFELRSIKCSVCSKWYKHPEERQTDVNIATHLVSDAYEDAYDTAYLVSADADLVPAVQFVRERRGKTVVLIDPPRRHSDALAAQSDRHWHFAESHLRQSQLPNPVEYEKKAKVRRIYRPPSWAPSD
jgi:uncharacterized LabA/DUF88 family protein